MARIIQGEHFNPGAAPELTDVKYDYDYKNGLDFSPKGKLHSRIKREILQRANESSVVMTRKHDTWRALDRALTAYVPLDTKETKLQDGDSRLPMSIVIPESYANLEILLTYMTAVYLSDSAIFRYEGTGPEDVIPTILLELVVAQHCRRTKVPLNMMTMWRDGFVYGFGAVHPNWKKESGPITSVEKRGGFFSDILSSMVKPTKEKVRKTGVRFEGNALENIDPFMYLPDPNVPIHEPSRGEFSSWLTRENRLSLLEREHEDKEFFNALYLKHINGRSQYYREHLPSDERTSVDSAQVNSAKPIDLLKMYWKLIPSEWGLGPKEYPEWWYFEVAGDEVILAASPAGHDHGMAPIAVCAPDTDGRSMLPVSRMEIIYGGQHFNDWLISSRIHDIRKNLNGTTIVDPFRINYDDLTDSRPGKVVRALRNAWGTDITKSVFQLPTNDVTKGNIQDMLFIMDTMKRSSGAVDSLQGVMRGGSERRSATEARDTRMSALSRLEKTARLVGEQAHHDIAMQFAHNTIQLMEEDSYVRAVGEWEEALRNDFNLKGDESHVKVSPLDLTAPFDVIPHDGRLPGGEYADLMIQMFQTIGSSPELAQIFDVGRIGKHWFRSIGIKNADDFIRAQRPQQTNVMPDEEVEKQVQRGNIVPMEAGGGQVETGV